MILELDRYSCVAGAPIVTAALVVLVAAPGCVTRRMWSHLGYEAEHALSAEHIGGRRFHAELLFANNKVYTVEFPGIRGVGVVQAPGNRPAKMPNGRVVPMKNVPEPRSIYITRGDLRVLLGDECEHEYLCPRVDRTRDPALIAFVLATPITAIVDLFATPAEWIFVSLQPRH